jgi:diguanylate cyclase (GGDEF)-like protein
MRALVVLGGLVPAFVLGAALVGFQMRSEAAVSDAILSQARAHAREFNALRAYVQGHSGVYVPASENTPVNPNLEDIEGVVPAISGPDGRTYVLQNSPLVAREVSKILEKDTAEERVSMRLYGLRPINAANEPDEFALQAINRFEAGEQEVYAYAKAGDHDVFRYALMIPCTERCGACHANLAGKTDGVAGATVVEIDVTRPLAYVDRSRTWTLVVLIGVIVMTIVGLYFAVSRILGDMNRAQVRLYDMARTDSLTGLPTRRVGMEQLAEEIERSVRQGRGLACCVLDLDEFKKVNDELGHHVGDTVLAAVGAAIRDGLRPYDVAARLGGEEFILVLPDTDEREARDVVERIRVKVELAASRIHVLRRPLTCSAGIAVFDPAVAESVDQIYVRADTALLQAKGEGKDRSRVAPAADGARAATAVFV